MNKYVIKYFAILKDQTGKDSETVEIDSTDPRTVFEQLRKKYSIEMDRDKISLAVNDEFVSWDQKLSSGDQLVFVTPVSGG